MSDEEIDGMEAGRKMDALIAEKVMGKPHVCRLIGDGVTEPFHLDVPSAVWRERSPADRHWERFSPCGADRVVNDFAVPYYSTDIGGAWQVVEKMRQSGHAQEFADRYINETPWHWVFLKTEAFCLNICRAALKTIAREDALNAK